MAVHDGLDIAVVIVFHLVADTRAAGFRRDGLDTDTPDNDPTDPPDPDDPTVTVTATATATQTGSVVAATSGTTSDNSTLSSGASNSNGGEVDQGVKAGIAIGVIVGVFFIAGAIFMIVRRWLRNRRANNLSPDDPNNPRFLAARNVPPSGGGGSTGSEEKRPVITTSSADGGANRPWFDTGTGSTELEAGRGGPPRLGPSSWALEKAELPTPRRDMTLELPDARGTRFEPVELPAAMPFMPPDPNQDEAIDRMGMVGVWRRGSQSTWATGTTSSHNTGTYVSSPTGTTTTGEVFQGTISPCSTGSDGNNAGKTTSLAECPNSVPPRNKD